MICFEWSRYTQTLILRSMIILHQRYGSDGCSSCVDVLFSVICPLDFQILGSHWSHWSHFRFACARVRASPFKNPNEIRTIITQKQQVRKRSCKTHVSFTTSTCTWQIRNTKAFSRNAHSTHTFYNLLVNVNAHLTAVLTNGNESSLGISWNEKW